MAAPTRLEWCTDYQCGEFFDWVLDSDIQAPEGYFYDWHDLSQARSGLPYPEITGYGLSTLCWLFSRTGNEQLLRRAWKAFKWLDTRALDPQWNLVKARESAGNGRAARHQYLYPFDTGMIAAGVTRLSRHVPDTRVQHVLDRISESFLQKLLRTNGTIWPLVDVQTQTPMCKDGKWSYRFSGYQLKTLMFFPLRHGHTKANRYTQRVIKVFEKVLGNQQKCGAFPGFENGETHLHPHFYALEGLVVAADIYERPEWLERVTKGYLYTERFFVENGYLPTQTLKDHITVPFERTDILAQFLRMGSYLVSVGLLERASTIPTLSAAQERLLRYQVREGTQRGGFLFGQDFDGSVKNHVNSWASFFAGQALHWFELARGCHSIDPEELV